MAYKCLQRIVVLVLHTSAGISGPKIYLPFMIITGTARNYNLNPAVVLVQHFVKNTVFTVIKF
jgi:hypothetical protein